jgi:hypothetical protein
LNIKTDFIVSGGTLQGKVTPRDEGTDSRFTIPFNMVDGKLKGTIMLLPKFPLTRQVTLTKQKSNPEQHVGPVLSGAALSADPDKPSR